MFPLLLYFLLSMFIAQYKISVMLRFLLPFKMIFYSQSNRYLTLKKILYCIPHFIIHSAQILFDPYRGTYGGDIF